MRRVHWFLDKPIVGTRVWDQQWGCWESSGLLVPVVKKVDVCSQEKWKGLDSYWKIRNQDISNMYVFFSEFGYSLSLNMSSERKRLLTFRIWYTPLGPRHDKMGPTGETIKAHWDQQPQAKREMPWTCSRRGCTEPWDMGDHGTLSWWLPGSSTPGKGFRSFPEWNPKDGLEKMDLGV